MAILNEVQKKRLNQTIYLRGWCLWLVLQGFLVRISAGTLSWKSVRQFPQETSRVMSQLGHSRSFQNFYNSLFFENPTVQRYCMQPRTLTASKGKHISAKVPDLLDRMKAETLQKVVAL